MKWSVPQAQRWIDTVFELFGTKRIMFGSHRPISRLSRSFASVYAGYEEMTAGLSESEQDSVFRRNAAEWFPSPMGRPEFHACSDKISWREALEFRQRDAPLPAFPSRRIVNTFPASNLYRR